MTHRTEVGKRGEDLVCAYLVKNKYKILMQNYHEKFDEIDVIARSFNGVLVFCEVKTMMLRSLGFKQGLTPEDNLTNAKLKKIRRASQMFVAKHPALVDDKIGWRIDCAAVVINEDGQCHTIRYYENI